MDTKIILWLCLAALQSSVAKNCTRGIPNVLSAVDPDSLSLPPGVQVLVPGYRFDCKGVITTFFAQVSSTTAASDNSARNYIDFQVWSPVNGVEYTLHWAGRYPSPISTRVAEGIIVLDPIFGIPVSPGDILGFFVSEAGTGLENSLHYGDSSEINQFYVDTSTAPCNFSVCDTSVEMFANTAPHVAVGFEPREDTAVEEQRLLLARVSESCSTSSFTLCPQPTRDSMPTTISVPEAVSNVLMTPSPPEPPGGNNGTQEPPGLEESGKNVSLTLEAIIFLSIGLLLFVILIVLVAILAICIGHRYRSLQRLGRSKARVGSVGGISDLATNDLNHSEELHSSGHYYSVADDLSLATIATATTDWRSLSTSALLNGKIPPPRRHSVSSTASSAINHGNVVLVDNNIPPLPHVEDSSTHYYSQADILPLTTSGGYDHLTDAGSSLPPPLSLNDRYGYDHLDVSSPAEPPILQTNTTDIGREATFSDNSFDSSDSQGYGYVPTEEQRRRLARLFKNGYEVSISENELLPQHYDKLQFFKESKAYWAPATTTSGLYNQLSNYQYREIPQSKIEILKSIGKGHFGAVSLGVWQIPGGQEEVAIKTAKAESEAERLKLLQEAAIMGQFVHHNVVRLHGVVTVGEPVMIVLEMMPRGDLRSFLQKVHPRNSKRECPVSLPSQFISFAMDIAAGMDHLAKKNFVHRDLAARNILLTNDLTCKIGDFGMARDIDSESDYYKSHGGIVPVKWTPPEALNYNKYSSASDVWSYGMVLFEIWSVGQKPFHNLTNPIVVALVSSRHCQPPPPGCPRPIYHLMVECWHPQHGHRPTFDSIYNYLSSSGESLIKWQPDDIIPGKQAHILGAPLLEANNLYFDLQRTYQQAQPKRR